MNNELGIMSIIFPLFLFIIAAGVAGYFIYKQWIRRLAYHKLLLNKGFRVVSNDVDDIDLSVSKQWPTGWVNFVIDSYESDKNNIQIRVVVVDCYNKKDDFLDQEGVYVPHEEVKLTLIAYKFRNIDMPQLFVFERSEDSEFRTEIEGYKEICSGDAEFDRKFVALGAEKDSLGKLFTAPVIEKMLDKNGLILESGKNTVLMYKQNAILIGQELEDILLLGEELIKDYMVDKKIPEKRKKINWLNAGVVVFGLIAILITTTVLFFGTRELERRKRLRDTYGFLPSDDELAFLETFCTQQNIKLAGEIRREIFACMDKNPTSEMQEFREYLRLKVQPVEKVIAVINICIYNFQKKDSINDARSFAGVFTFKEEANLLNLDRTKVKEWLKQFLQNTNYELNI